MSNVRGRIAIDVQFTDSTTSEGVQSLKTITLQDATEYTTGNVAIVTGTVGTAQQNIDTSQYLDAAGQQVTFSAVTRIAVQSSGREVRYLISAVPEIVGLSSVGEVAVGNISPVFAQLTNHRVRTTSGTASYTLVLYGT